MTTPPESSIDLPSSAKASWHRFLDDVIAAICAELAVPCRVNGYRYW